MRGWRGALAATLVLAILGAGCALAPPSQRHPAAVVVARLLVLRRERNADAAAYRPLFKDSAVASDLAQAAGQTSTSPPTPDWQAPYVSAVGSSTADVVVVWKRSQLSGGWPEATIFKMEKGDGAWRVLDAVSVAKPADVPEPSAVWTEGAPR